MHDFDEKIESEAKSCTVVFLVVSFSELESEFSAAICKEEAASFFLDSFSSLESKYHANG